MQLAELGIFDLVISLGETHLSQDDEQATRRDFLYYATGGTGAVVVGAAVWPLINQMNPSADVRPFLL